MDCRDVTQLGVERLTGEAGAEARAALAEHLASCERCREEMGTLEGVWARLGTDPDATVRPEFRRETLALLESEMVRRRVRAFRPRSRMASPLLRAAALVLAAATGYFAARAIPGKSAPVVASVKPAAAPAGASGAAAALPDLKTEPRLSNVSYQPADKDGRVGIGFDVTSRHTVVGRPDDPEVARLLAYMVSKNAETAGEKSRAIEVLSEHFGSAAGSTAPVSPEILAALSNTLRKDANPGVRKKAADALASFPMSPEIRAVFLEALRSDKNPAVRLVAVDALAAAAKQAPDENTIQSLREKAADPQENNFVRAKAANALKAIAF
ncbi:MAG TPA: HEAT repeat domain-containing protein [Thermoanaerobaculia bacterium]